MIVFFIVRLIGYSQIFNCFHNVVTPRSPQTTASPASGSFSPSRRDPLLTDQKLHTTRLAPPLSPDSGQIMRLRGGEGPWEGYVEVRGGRDRPWGYVCDDIDGWTLQEASVICRHLGFLRLVLKVINRKKT